jgi:hypothetical protein
MLCKTMHAYHTWGESEQSKKNGITNRTGITNRDYRSEAKERLETQGRNELTPKKGKPEWMKLLAQARRLCDKFVFPLKLAKRCALLQGCNVQNMP